MSRVYIALGSNIEPRLHIAKALELLSATVSIGAVSTFYWTEAIGRPEQGDYLNGVICVETGVAPHELKSVTLRGIEAELGRVRSTDKYAARTIDLDVLVYADLVLAEEGFVLPDPDVLERPFLACGLLELEPSLKWPGSGRLLKECIDPIAFADLRADVEFSRILKERWFHES